MDCVVYGALVICFCFFLSFANCYRILFVLGSQSLLFHGSTIRNFASSFSFCEVPFEQGIYLWTIYQVLVHYCIDDRKHIISFQHVFSRLLFSNIMLVFFMLVN